MKERKIKKNKEKERKIIMKLKP